MDDLPAILTSNQAARLLQMDCKTITEMARDGIVPANRAPGGRWKFSRDALIKWSEGFHPLGAAHSTFHAQNS